MRVKADKNFRLLWIMTALHNDESAFGYFRDSENYVNGLSTEIEKPAPGKQADRFHHVGNYELAVFIKMFGQLHFQRAACIALRSQFGISKAIS